jgi:hypothetical protein
MEAWLLGLVRHRRPSRSERAWRRARAASDAAFT